jgi:hypothetical protein
MTTESPLPDLGLSGNDDGFAHPGTAPYFGDWDSGVPGTEPRGKG